MGRFATERELAFSTQLTTEQNVHVPTKTEQTLTHTADHTSLPTAAAVAAPAPARAPVPAPTVVEAVAEVQAVPTAGVVQMLRHPLVPHPLEGVRHRPGRPAPRGQDQAAASMAPVRKRVVPSHPRRNVQALLPPLLCSQLFRLALLYARSSQRECQNRSGASASPDASVCRAPSQLCQHPGTVAP